MQIDLATHIEKLIFLHDTVVVPQLGGFVATRISSAADDNGSGVINPPTRALAFNETLVYDDGLLINDIAQSNNIPLEDARDVVQKAVDALQSRLNQREIVSLNGVGRLYKNYVQKIQFLPDSANFSTESYGLPPLQFSTIARSREVTEQQAPAAAAPAYAAPDPQATTFSTASTESAPRRGRWVTPVLLTILLLASAIAIWRWQSAGDGRNLMDVLRGARGTTPDTTQQVVVQPETAAQPNNASDATNDTAQNPTDSSDDKLEVEMLTEPEPKKEEATLVLTPEAQEVVMGKTDEPKAKPATAGKECILIVATLSDASNIQKLKTKLADNQFTVYDAPKGKGRQIGIRFNYSNVVEIQDNIVALQKLTDQREIWIKKK
ncbi:MAG: hypothetical protein IT270_00580 [Saprospiraceae bacterium]|nr:hypothetical protein [Saprospiraceae bacterium]